jgi:hypothetical protein
MNAVLWTARLCVGCYLLRYVVAASGRDRARLQCWLWTTGWALLVVHTAAAFQFVHHWSHAAAVASTARQTEELLGVTFGGGVWFNYAAIVVWGADVAFWWRRKQNPGVSETPQVLWSVTVQAYLAMMVVSATVVFGPRFWWIIAAAFAAGIAVARASASRERQRPERSG